MPTMNDRQHRAFGERIFEATNSFEMPLPPTRDAEGRLLSVDDLARGWIITYAEESRVGRGHEISAVYIDSDYIAQITINIYGHSTLSIGDIDWRHNSEDPDEEVEPGLGDSREKESLHG